MSHDDDTPQLYLISPPEVELSRFPDTLAACLDRVPVACVRLALSSRDEDIVARAADAVREVAIARDVALVIENHVFMVERLGLDGVHLTDGSRTVRQARKTLGPDAIVGAFCGNSRHDGMTAGELGADYIAFGPVSQNAFGAGQVAEAELFEWWSQMIEVPVVAEGGLDPATLEALKSHTDFLGIGPEIWDEAAPDLALATIASLSRS